MVDVPLTRGRIAGLAWACLGCGVGGGFFLGSVAGGWLGERVVEAVIGGAVGLVAVVVLAVRLGGGKVVGLPPRIALVLSSTASGFLIGWAARVGEDLRYSAQLEAWFGETSAKAGVGLLAFAIGIAVFLSVRRPRWPASMPLPPPPAAPHPPVGS